MRKLFIAGNWKMHKTTAEAIDYINQLKPLVQETTNKDLVLCATFTLLPKLKEMLSDSNIKLGAQNMFYEEEGAYTGEVSPTMIKEFCEYVIIGHSERRKYFGETNETVNKKIKKALEHNIKVIFCVGEKLEENENGQTKEVIKQQVEIGLKEISDIKDIVIAYEPVWAIGTGKTATPEYAESTHKFIREIIEEKYGNDIANQTRIIYGGSVKPENAKELLKKENIDGALPGGASLDPEKFFGIVDSI